MRTSGRFGIIVLALAALLGTAAVAGAQNQCLLGFQDASGRDIPQGGSLCAQATGKTCSVTLKLCANLTEKGCTTGTIKKTVKAKGSCGGAGKVKVKASGTSETCGSPASVTVKLKKKGTLSGTCQLKVKAKTTDKRTDSETLSLTCNPPSGPACPTTTTTTITTGSTTTTTMKPPPCVNPNCCPSPTSLLKFTNMTGTGNCGAVKDASGTKLFDLTCGGLYTGAGAATLSLPAPPPDMGTNYTKTSGCSGDNFNLGPTLPSDLATVAPTNPHRNCTSAGVADPDYPACVGGTNAGKPCVTNTDCPSGGTCTGTMPGCLFGAPLAIPNPGFAGASVCVVNRISSNASGSGNCSTGTTNLSLPLSSDLYLTGDLLDGSAPDRPNVAGINPCPICNPGTNTCQGGPRHGMACHPDTSALSSAYPTSHDCPPPPGPGSSNYIGALPIPFDLTTDPSGTAPQEHKIANNTGLAGQEVFCGFCGAQFSQTFHNPPMPCATDADCTVTGCPNTTACNRCKQSHSGAFGPSVSPSPGSEHEMTLTGAAAGCLGDGMPHASTLVSAFCIPPAYNSTVDANGDLPGPGAVSLPGTAQILP